MSAAKKLIDLLKEDVKATQKKVNPTYIKLVEVFPLQPITSKSHYEMSLRVIEKLISYKNEERISDEGVELYLKTLAELVGDWEAKYYAAVTVNGAEMLAYLMELQDLSQNDLSEELGGQSVVSKILNGTRELNLRQIKALAKRFKVSPQVFID